MRFIKGFAILVAAVRRMLELCGTGPGVAALFIVAYAVSTPAQGDPTYRPVLASAGDGSALFDQYCMACHGADARGIASLGVDLVGSAFVAGSSEAALEEFLKVGRLPDDPASKSGRPMPGFGWVPESELRSIAAFLKSRASP